MIYKDEQFYKPRDGKSKTYTKKNIIFLDIDGVLQPTYNKRRFDHDLEKTAQYIYDSYNDPIYLQMDQYDLGAVYYDWSLIATGALREIIENTHSSIVIHSSWIYGMSFEKLKALFRLYELDQFIIDIAKNENMNKIDAINHYLDKHQDIDDYVVIDDDCYLLAAFGEHCCLTKEFLNADNAHFCEYILNLSNYKMKHIDHQFILKYKSSDGLYHDFMKLNYKLFQYGDNQMCLYYISRYDFKYDYMLLLYHAFSYFYKLKVRSMVSEYKNYLQSRIDCHLVSRIKDDLVYMSLYYGADRFLDEFDEDELIEELEILKEK